MGASVVNALSSMLEVEVARDKTLYRQVFSRGRAEGGLTVVGPTANRRGTLIRFQPDEEIFGVGCRFKPAQLFLMAQSKAYLFAGVEIRWHCPAELIKDSQTPEEAVLCFPGGLADYLAHSTADKPDAGKPYRTNRAGRPEI